MRTPRDNANRDGDSCLPPSSTAVDEAQLPLYSFKIVSTVQLLTAK